MNGSGSTAMNALKKIAGKLVLCAVLAGCAVGLVYLVSTILESNAPFVDFSSRVQPSGERITPAEQDDRLRFAVASMVSAEETFSTYRRLVQRICRDMGRKEAFVLRPSYADVRRELERGNVAVAFVCTGTYMHALPGKRIELLVQPEFEAGLDYRSQLIVPIASTARRVDDLRGGVMAFTDPESNTGCIVPRVMLADLGWEAESFFKKVIFTGSHDRSIQAVASSVVDAAAVDSLILVSKKLQDPSIASHVRVLWQSEAYGPPPVVVPASLDEQLKRSLKEAFLKLHNDREGREILSAIGIRRFVPARAEDYSSAVELYNRLHRNEELR